MSSQELTRTPCAVIQYHDHVSDHNSLSELVYTSLASHGHIFVYADAHSSPEGAWSGVRVCGELRGP